MRYDDRLMVLAPQYEKEIKDVAEKMIHLLLNGKTLSTEDVVMGLLREKLGVEEIKAVHSMVARNLAVRGYVLVCYPIIDVAIDNPLSVVVRGYHYKATPMHIPPR